MKDITPIYFHSATYAHEHGGAGRPVDVRLAPTGAAAETWDQYRASHKANIACKEAIEQAIADNYRDNCLGSACVQQVLQKFDYGRIFYVLANTVQQKNYDGRISRDNKAWAQTIPVCEDKDGFGYDRNVSFVVDRSHTGLMDLFLTQARREYALAQEKPSVRDSLNKSAGQQAAHGDKPKMKKEQTR